MKNLISGIYFLSGIWMVSCHPDQQVSTNISSTLMEGNWHVEYFMDSSQNKTANFNGFGFKFSENELVKVSRGDTVTVLGQWFTGDDNDLTNMALQFGDTLSFNDLNKDWDAFEITDNQVKFRVTNLTTSYLTFQKL